MNLSGRLVAVTGASGFIGSALVAHLLAAGATVRALTWPPGISPKPAPRSAVELCGDITEAETVRRLCRDTEIVIHLAGPPSVAVSFDQPTEYAQVHVLGTLEVLKACSAFRVPHLIYISSAEVYGRPRDNPVSEKDHLTAWSPYAACKIAAEQLINAYAVTTDMRATILRPFSIYGPHLSPLSLIGGLFWQVRNSRSLRVRDMRPIRDYCYVDDLVAAIICACVCTHERVLTLNIGSGQGYSVRQVVDTLLQVLQFKITVHEDDIQRVASESTNIKLVADIRRAKTILGWTPTISLVDGLSRIALSQNLVAFNPSDVVDGDCAPRPDQ